MRSGWLPALALLSIGTLAAMAPAPMVAADDEVPQVKVTTMLEGLDNPCGVAVQPGTGHVFISESGAGRITRITPTGRDVAISDFPKGNLGEDPGFEVGPLGLAFVGRNVLVVGGGGQHAAKDVIRFFEVPPPGKTIDADKAYRLVGPWKAGESSAHGEGDFYAVVADGLDSIFVTSHGDDGKGWVSRIEVAEGKPGPVLPLVSIRTASGVHAPVGLAVSPRGEIVVSQNGDAKTPHNGLLTFYDPQTKKLLLKLDTGLHDIAGLAYSPRTGWLYAADFSWSDPKQGGVYRLDKSFSDGRQGVKAVLITALDKPTSLVFAPNGALYVTTFGTARKDSKQKPGSLVHITGKL